jgi:hypothetical protein
MEKTKSRFDWYRDVKPTTDVFYHYFGDLPQGKSIVGKILKFNSKLETGKIVGAMEFSCKKFTATDINWKDKKAVSDVADQCLNYFCGICWNEIKKQSGNATVLVARNGE